MTKRPIFEFLSSLIRPDSSLTVFAFADDYSFGILQSGIHWAWFTAKCSTLTARFRYTSDTVFDTFPWPQFASDPPSPDAAIPKGLNHSAQGCDLPRRSAQRRREARATLGNAPQPPANSERVASPSASLSSTTVPAPAPHSALRPPHSALEKVRAVAEAARSLRALRREIMQSNGWSLRDLYRTLETPGANRLRDAHAALDSAVRAAYGMSEAEDTLAFLLRLNLELADKEAKGHSISPPGLPAFVSTGQDFVSPDCIQVS